MAKARGLEAPKVRPLPRLDLDDVTVDGDDEEQRFDLARLRFEARSEAKLDYATLAECELPEVRVETLSAQGARFSEVRISDSDIVTWRGRDSSWRDVELDAGRVGSLDLSDSDISATTFTGLRVGYLDLRAATIGDVVFERCSFGSLDLPSATLKRVRFIGCTVDELDLRMADCTSVDLRGLQIGTKLEIAGRNGRGPLDGVYVTPGQAADLAPVLARTVGLTLL